MRRGFGMIQVLFFMVLMATLLTIMMKYATISVRQTEDTYLREQAELFMQSAIELALLGIQRHDKSGGLLRHIRIISDDKRFIADVNVTKYYLYPSTIQTEESNGMVAMQIVVETNATHPKNSRRLRFTRRTLQRP
ncbi:MAG: hypothetical protein B6D59_01140 [Campylobacteraceae bacterium 4484_4]|nr:MAG: hypothetical protein B6D59_01140 [Campylobacteraceae bacterium 4484_4]